MITIYGILNSEGIHIDTSNTERGAKNYATRNGYKTVTVRHGYNAFIIATKEGIKWIAYEKSN